MLQLRHLPACTATTVSVHGNIDPRQYTERVMDVIQQALQSPAFQASMAVATMAALTAGQALNKRAAKLTAQMLSRLQKKKGRLAAAPVEDLLKQLTANALEAGRLASLVQVEIEAQLAQVEKLRKDAKEAEHLAALHGAAADVVAAQVRSAVEAAVQNEGKKSTRYSFWSSVLFFIAGVAASIFVTLLVRPIGS